VITFLFLAGKSFFSQYALFWITEMIDAYVDGLPIFKLSNSLIKDASEYLAAGLLYTCPETILMQFND
jgi:hypothetical protein